MKNNLKRIIALFLCGVLMATMAITLVGCGSDKTVYDNESDALVFSTLEADKVFNPFFSTSGTDSNVVGMTQISMIANDKEGNPGGRLR